MFSSRNHFATEKRNLDWCVQSYPATKLFADILIPDCGYLAIKKY